MQENRYKKEQRNKMGLPLRNRITSYYFGLEYFIKVKYLVKESIVTFGTGPGKVPRFSQICSVCTEMVQKCYRRSLSIEITKSISVSQWAKVSGRVDLQVNGMHFLASTIPICRASCVSCARAEVWVELLKMVRLDDCGRSPRQVL